MAMATVMAAARTAAAATATTAARARARATTTALLQNCFYSISSFFSSPLHPLPLPPLSLFFLFFPPDPPFLSLSLAHHPCQSVSHFPTSLSIATLKQTSCHSKAAHHRILAVR